MSKTDQAAPKRRCPTCGSCKGKVPEGVGEAESEVDWTRISEPEQLFYHYIMGKAGPTEEREAAQAFFVQTAKGWPHVLKELVENLVSHLPRPEVSK
jgi:hypothetical protein